MIHTPKNPSFSSRRSTSQSVHYHTTQGYNQGGDIEYGRRWYMTYHLLEMCNAKDRVVDLDRFIDYDGHG